GPTEGRRGTGLVGFPAASAPGNPGVGTLILQRRSREESAGGHYRAAPSCMLNRAKSAGASTSARSDGSMPAALMRSTSSRGFSALRKVLRRWENAAATTAE